MLTAANCQAVNTLKTPLNPWMGCHDYMMVQEAWEGGAI